MSYFEICLSSKEILSLEEKKKYIDSMYGRISNKNQYRNGFIHKFNNAIGFAALEIQINKNSSISSEKISSPKEYITPKQIILNNFRTPAEGLDILKFYIPNKRIQHSDARFTYTGRELSKKWINFLEKVFPINDIIVSMKKVQEIPKQSIREFALNFFFSNIQKNEVVTIEYISERLLTKEDLDYIHEKIKVLTDDEIIIGQFDHRHLKCDYSYFIELIYFSLWGRDIGEKEKNKWKKNMIFG